MAGVQGGPHHVTYVEQEEVTTWSVCQVDAHWPGHVARWKGRVWNRVAIEHVEEEGDPGVGIQTPECTAFPVLHGLCDGGGVVLGHVVQHPGWGMGEHQPDEVVHPHHPAQQPVEP